MAHSILRTYGGVELPAPVKILVGNEIIWSANTGRTTSGKMVGTAIADKDTLSIEWGVLTNTQFELLKTHLVKGFYKLYFYDDEIEVYRGTLTGEDMGYLGDGIRYWKSANAEIVQR